jgi:hypothetical protein
MLLQRLAATGTDQIGQSDFDRWSGPLVGGRAGAKAEASLARLASRALGLGLAFSLGEGGGWSLRIPRELIELSPQGRILSPELLDPGVQRSEFCEQLSDERQQGLFAQLSEFFEGRHEADL